MCFQLLLQLINDTTVQLNLAICQSGIPLHICYYDLISTQANQFREGERSVVQSNSMYGHLVWRQRLIGVSSVCSLGSSKPIITAVPSTYITCWGGERYQSQAIILANSYVKYNFYRLSTYCMLFCAELHIKLSLDRNYEQEYLLLT